MAWPWGCVWALVLISGVSSLPYGGLTAFDDYLAFASIILGTAMVLASIAIGFLRGAQLAWFDLQYNRLRRRHCPNCDYSLRGIVSDRCPECGCDIAAAAHEVKRARA
jgi:predicted nucleic-acid-binding Zn-ribbon protein